MARHGGLHENYRAMPYQNRSSYFSPKGCDTKNLGRFWLAYTELQGGCYMLHLMTDDSGHFTQPDRHPYQYHVRLWACSESPDPPNP